MRIYLIGMMGSGKSTLGKMLAKKLNYDFIDMDHYIEQKACMFIDEIFDLYGEEYFRALETNTLTEFLNLDNVVIATGGGVIKNKEHKKLMDKCIYLSVPVSELERRLKYDSTRPLLKTKSVSDIFNERKEMYDYFADITVDNTNVDKAIKNIMEALK